MEEWVTVKCYSFANRWKNANLGLDGRLSSESDSSFVLFIVVVLFVGVIDETGYIGGMLGIEAAREADQEVDHCWEEEEEVLLPLLLCIRGYCCCCIFACNDWKVDSILVAAPFPFPPPATLDSAVANGESTGEVPEGESRGDPESEGE